MKKLTVKQRLFIKRYVQNKGNGTQAVLDTYDTTDPNVAKVIASNNLTLVNVREALDEALRSQGLTLSQIAGNLGELANAKPSKVSADTVLRANVEILKLQGVYPNPKSYQYSYSIKQNLSTLPYKDLKQELEKIDNELHELVEGG